LCLPGDRLKLSGLSMGPGMMLDEKDVSKAFATAAGVVKRTPDQVLVENLQKRYIPRQGDVVVGIVVYRMGEAYKVDIKASSQAYLPNLSFNGATRRNRPVLELGAIILARVESAHPDLDTELSCIEPDSKKSWNTGEIVFGELKGGFNFEVPISAAQRLLSVECFVLDRLGQDFAYELSVGQNGRVWLSAPSDRETVLLVQAIRRSFGMSDVQVEPMIAKMVEMFS